MEQDARTRIIQARVTRAESASLQAQAADLGISLTQLIRDRLIGGNAPRTVDTKELLRKLDTVGTELGRTGNNINQLARHANTLSRQGISPYAAVDAFIPLFRDYIRRQENLEKLLRHLLRKMAGS